MGGACLLLGITGCATGKPKTALSAVFTNTCPKAYEMSVSKIPSLLTSTERKRPLGDSTNANFCVLLISRGMTIGLLLLVKFYSVLPNT